MQNCANQACTDTIILAVQRGTPGDILASFGRGKAGSLLALGRLVLSSTAMWLYGGFIRDLVLRADVYDSQDLDVGLPYSGLDAAAGMSTIATLAASIGMQFLRTHPRGDPRVVRGFFQAVDSSVEIEVQVAITVKNFWPAACMVLLLVCCFGIHAEYRERPC